MRFGRMGGGFGRLGASTKKPPSTPPPGGAPTLQFNSATNSQLLALLEDF